VEAASQEPLPDLLPMALHRAAQQGRRDDQGQACRCGDRTHGRCVRRENAWVNQGRTPQRIRMIGVKLGRTAASRFTLRSAHEPAIVAILAGCTYAHRESDSRVRALRLR
jgi:hypothetical protein